MPSRPITPESLGPEIIISIEGSIAQAKRAEGSARLGPIAERLSQLYRALAICLLADETDPDGFFHWLVHSPLVWRHYLITVGTKGLGDLKAMGASNVDPVLDAMAARQWKLAAHIAGLLSPNWLEGQEYEDDYCYGDFLRRLVTGTETGMADLLSRWRDALEGGDDPRLAIAQAIHARSSDDFEPALRSLLEATDKRTMAMSDPITGSPLASDCAFFPNRWVSIEGLALLAAAERAGIRVDFEADHCPRIVRTGIYAAFSKLGYPYEDPD
jgi:hypothetical protein